MATNLRPLPPPVGDPMMDKNNIITPSWADWVNNVYRFQLLLDTSEDDGTYTVGTGTTDGEITLVSGVITSIQEVVP